MERSTAETVLALADRKSDSGEMRLSFCALEEGSVGPAKLSATDSDRTSGTLGASIFSPKDLEIGALLSAVVVEVTKVSSSRDHLFLSQAAILGVFIKHSFHSFFTTLVGIFRKSSCSCICLDNSPHNNNTIFYIKFQPFIDFLV